MGDDITRARAWIANDPDPATRAALTAVVESAEAGDEAAAAELRSLVDGRIGFGTAGLRAELGPGPLRMNRLVVRQTTAGLVDWLGDDPLVVVGYDARHGSAIFARDVAEVVAARGGWAELLPEPLPTPVLARAVLDRGADAGVMITASHNPPADNGYKLYLGDGIQLVAPADREIAAAIDRIAAEDPAVDGEVDPDRIIVLDGEPAAQHRRCCRDVLVTDQRSVRLVVTPMHGVGGAHLLAALAEAGFPAPSVVEEQFEPDPDFPTVSFPNPEEPGALDLALARAAEVSADLVLANDPDADRLAVAVPARTSDGYTALSGDELGVLLADHVLRHRDPSVGPFVVANSIVSSRLLAAMAATLDDVDVEITLTGFKWVARPMVDGSDRTYLFGYEEAIGYCVGDAVRDKDGISAALVASELVAGLLAGGRTVWDRLDELAVRHGVHRTAPVTIRLDGDAGDDPGGRRMRALRAEPPEQLGGAERTRWVDLAVDGPLPPTDGVLAEFGDLRLIVRPSGTEPKLKAYLEVIEPVDGSDDLARATEAADARLERAVAEVRERLV